MLFKNLNMAHLISAPLQAQTFLICFDIKIKYQNRLFVLRVCGYQINSPQLLFSVVILSALTLNIFFGRVGLGVRRCLLVSPSSPLRATPVNSAEPLSSTMMACMPS